MLREILGSRKFVLGLAALIVGTAALWLASARPFERGPETPEPLPNVAQVSAQAMQHDRKTNDASDAQDTLREKRRELEARVSQKIDRVLGVIDDVLGDK